MDPKIKAAYLQLFDEFFLPLIRTNKYWNANYDFINEKNDWDRPHSFAVHSILTKFEKERGIPQTNADLSAGTWRGDYYMYENVGPELEGSTVGLVAANSIAWIEADLALLMGGHVDLIASGLGIRAYSSPTPTSPIGVDSALVRVRAANGMLAVDTLAAFGPTTVVLASGTFGLREGTSGELTYRVQVDSLTRWSRWLGVRDTTPVPPRKSGIS